MVKEDLFSLMSYSDKKDGVVLIENCNLDIHDNEQSNSYSDFIQETIIIKKFQN